MGGIRVFRSLGDALKDGWHEYDRTKDGILVRKFINGSWNLAIVSNAPHPELPELEDSPHFHFGADPE